MHQSSKILLLVTATLVVALGCRERESQEPSTLLDSSASIQPLAERHERHELCGIESYKSEAHSVCGVKAYALARSTACGIERYKAKADLACPGSVAADAYESKTTGACRTGGASDPAACRTDYHQIGFKRRTETCCSGHQCDNEIESDVEKTRQCRRDETLTTCRLPAFGVDRFNSCRHASHGVQTWKTCERPEFGVKSYKQCRFLLTPGEVDRYLASVGELLAFMGETFVASKATYYVETEDEAATACHIGRYDGDPLFDPQVAELKTLYQVRFGRTYAADRFQCDANPVSDIDAEVCADSDTSRKCKSVRSYRGAKKWLEVKLSDLVRLQGDVAAQRDQRVRDAIARQLAAVKEYDK